jgi:hypothetical protein
VCGVGSGVENSGIGESCVFVRCGGVVNVRFVPVLGETVVFVP